MSIGTLTPAYGDYKSKKAVVEAFNNNKDFVNNYMRSSQYINKQDIEKENVKQVTIRYSGNKKVTVIKFSLKKGAWE